MQEIKIIYRQGTYDDLERLKQLAIKSWSQFERHLSSENWNNLSSSLKENATYTELLNKSTCFVCTTAIAEIIGMVFLVPSGIPNEIYDKEWSSIRFLTVDPDFAGQGIGKNLVTTCIEMAKQNGEKIIALHTSEMMTRARHLYESLGFQIVREIDQRLGKRYWLYSLDLT